jgi:probable rRNA maturation factor
MKSEMSPDCALTLLNRQRTRLVNLRLLRRILETFLVSILSSFTPKQGRGRRGPADQEPNTLSPGVKGYHLTLYLVAESEMIHLNETHLRHEGSTDVITFDYTEPAQPDFLHGEIFVCLDEALIQARRFRTTWQSELVRYAVHGILHLSGYDDQTARARSKMKKVENRSMVELDRLFAFSKLARRPT